MGGEVGSEASVGGNKFSFNGVTMCFFSTSETTILIQKNFNGWNPDGLFALLH